MAIPFNLNADGSLYAGDRTVYPSSCYLVNPRSFQQKRGKNGNRQPRLTKCTVLVPCDPRLLCLSLNLTLIMDVSTVPYDDQY